MHLRTSLISIILSLLFPFTACAEAVQKTEPTVPYPIPAIKKDCTICHSDHGTKGMPLLKKQPSELCLDCHPDRKAPAEHRVDIAPTREIKQLPLTNGKITCSTCHDMHKNPYGKLLRMETNDLCFVCHPY